ncbi:hypothetical protein V6Z11_D07G022400 [Gossypium hirsutum]
MWSCGTLQSVWASLQIKIPSFDELSCCKHRFLHTFSTADDQQRQVMAISLWSLWFRRNKLIHEGVKLSFQELLRFIRGYVQDLNLNQESLRPSLRSMVKEFWQPPDCGVIKLNFDASFQNEFRIATIAVLARDWAGELIGTFRAGRPEATDLWCLVRWSS